MLTKKFYLSYNMLKLNPLEDNITMMSHLSGSGGNTDIWLLGDSRMSRWDDDLLSPLGGKIKNLGIEGQTTAQVLNRLKIMFEIEVPRWVLLEAGINDLKIIGLNKKYASSIKKTCYANIISIIESCKQNDVNIIVMNIFPSGDIELLRRFVWNASVDLAILEINSRLKSYCIGNNVPYFDAYNLLIDEKHNVKKIYQDDFLHINYDAYGVLTKNLIMQFGGLVNTTVN